MARSATVRGSGDTETQKASRFPWGCLIGILIVVLGVIGFVAFLLLFFSAGGDVDSFYSDVDVEEHTVEFGTESAKIALIPIKGVIATELQESGLLTTATASPERINPMIRKALKDDRVKAVVIDMDSPGGEVLASDLIYRKVKELDSKKPVVVWMGNQGASGGYYIASGATEIVAHPNTLTGSIGVIAQFVNMDGLYEKLGIKTKTFKSASFKDNAELWQGADTELNDVYQELIDETYVQFLEVVMDGRDLEKEEILRLADGRIYSGLQAQKNGLVDYVGIRDDAVERAKVLADLSDPDVVEYSSSTSIWGSFGLMKGALANVLGWSSDLSSGQAKPGLHMYYLAEPIGANF